MMKKICKSLSVIAAVFACAFSLTGCLSHWFMDSTTRLQVENRSSVAIVGIDVVSENGTEYKSWIQDTIRPGEKSRVYEEDWVGTFDVRFIFAGADTLVAHDVKFDGGSEYLVVSDSDKGDGLHYEFK